MITEFKKIYMKDIFNLLSNRLKKISEKHNIDYEELENKYLSEIKFFIEQ